MTEKKNCKLQLNIRNSSKKPAFLKFKENKGFSLVEVIVAIAILAIIALPILSSFANAAKINAKSRRVENANSMAGNVAEDFKSLSLVQLMEKYSDYRRYDNYNAAVEDKGGATVAAGDVKVTDYYVFTVENTGNNGEKFSSKVILDPSSYTDSDSENTANNINSYSMPQYSSLNGDKNIIIRDEVYKSDAEALRNLNVSTDDAGKLVKKSLVLTVAVSKSGLEENSYSQSVSGVITYIKKDDSSSVSKSFFAKSTTMSAAKSEDLDSQYILSANEGLKSVYLFYTPFDITRTEPLGEVSGETLTGINYIAADEVEINYEYPKDAFLTCSDCNVYLVQQQVNSRFNDLAHMALDRKNIKIKVNGSDIALQGFGTINLSDSGANGPVSIFSNVYGWSLYKKDSDINGNNSISQGSQSNGQGYLYRMIIEVEYEGEVYTTVTTTKENWL